MGPLRLGGLRAKGGDSEGRDGWSGCVLRLVGGRQSGQAEVGGGDADRGQGGRKVDVRPGKLQGGGHFAAERPRLARRG